MRWATVLFLCCSCGVGIYVPDPPSRPQDPAPTGEGGTGDTGEGGTGGTIAGTGGTGGSTTTTGGSTDEMHAFALLNADRAAHPDESCGGSPLRWNDQLADVARQHSQRVVQTGDFSHDDQAGTPFDRMTAAGIQYSTAGENLAEGGSPEEAEQLLMSDGPHRSLIMSCDMTDVGIGIATDGHGNLIVTQDFIRP